MLTYLFLATILMAFCMIAKRLESTILTAPMIFLAIGFLAAETDLMLEATGEKALHIVAEVTLVILLFIDAAKIDASALMDSRKWQARMLLVGLPLALVLGTIAFVPLLPGFSLALIALIAAILMTTDAALGQPVISNPDVPARTRTALTVESGLNDGMALPIVLMMAALAAPASAAPESGWIIFGLKQVTLGPLAGVILGAIGGKVLLLAKHYKSTSDAYEGVGALALAVASYLLANEIGGNGFISAFCAGLAFGWIVKGRCAFVIEFTESEGQFLSWASFFLLGAVLVPTAMSHLDIKMLSVILISLIVIRPLSIWLSLWGTDARRETKLFFGWFGPRGLATALFALMVAKQLDHTSGEYVLNLAINTVWISALLHGVTAWPGATWYAKRMKKYE